MIDLDELKRLAGLVTPGPLIADEDPCDGRDYKVLVTTKGARTFRGTWVMRAEHNWTDADYSERRISWKEAESNAAAAALLLSNLPTIIAALETAELVRDEDWLAGVMAAEFPTSSKMFPTWTKIKCKLSAREIIAALPKETDNAHD